MFKDRQGRAKYPPNCEGQKTKLHTFYMVLPGNLLTGVDQADDDSGAVCLFSIKPRPRVTLGFIVRCVEGHCREIKGSAYT